MDKPTTNVRWTVSFLIFLIAAVSYLDRTNLSVVAPVISKEFGFSETQMGVIFSSFTWAYVIGQIPGGMLSNRIGPRRMYLWAMWIWGAIIVLNIFVTSYTSWVLIRIPFGLVEAIAWPAAAIAVSAWFPQKEYSKAMSIQNLGLVAGPALAPPLVAYITADYGWQAAFVVTGVIAWVVATIWFFYFRDRPENHKSVSQSELNYIRQDRLEDEKVNTTVPGLSTYLFTRPSLWAAGFTNFGQGFVNFMFLTWFPSYLILTYHVNLKEMGILAMLPFILGIFTVPGSGYFSSYLLERTGKVGFARKVPIVAGLVLAAFFLFMVPFAHSMYVAIGLMSLGYACSVSILGAQWATPADVGGKWGSGFSGGFINCIGGIGGIISPLLMGYIYDKTGSFLPAIITAGVIDIVAVILFLVLYRVESDHKKVQSFIARVETPMVSKD